MDKSDLTRMPLPQLLDLWGETTTNNSPCIPTVRGWLMDELEKREPDRFNKWLEAKTGKIEAKANKLSTDAKAAEKARLAAEAKIKEERAAAIAEKKAAAEAAAREAAEAAAAETAAEEAAPEAPAAE